MCPSSILIRSHLQHGPVTEGFCFIHGHSKMQVVLALEASFQLAHRVPELVFYRKGEDWKILKWSRKPIDRGITPEYGQAGLTTGSSNKI